MKSIRMPLHHTTRWLGACLALALMTAPPLFANSGTAGATPAPSAMTESSRDIGLALGNPRVLGKAKLAVFGFDIYDATLWVTEGFSADRYDRQSFALELQYLRNFSGNMIAERSLKEMRNVGEFSEEKAAQWLTQMRAFMPDIKKGDRLVGVHRPDGSARFILNGQAIGDVRDAEFVRLFFGIWLSPQSSEPKMRRNLLGMASVSDKR